MPTSNKVNFYLTYDHTTVHNGKNFYYLRSTYIPSGLLENLAIHFIELELDCDIFAFVNALEPHFPRTIAAGTAVYHLSGASWTAPTDLYLLLIQGSPVADTLNPIVNDLKAVAPMAVYAEFPPATSLQPDIPSDVSPLEYPPNDDDYPEYRLPTGVFGWRNVSIVWEAAGKTFARLSFVGIMYEGCSIDCSNPVEQDINCHLAEFYFYGVDPYAFYIPAFAADNSSINCRWCCNDEQYVGGWYIQDETSGGDLLWVITMHTTSDTDPVAWYHPDLLGIPQAEQPISDGLSVVLDAAELMAPLFRTMLLQSVFLSASRHSFGVKNLYGLSSGDAPVCSGDSLIGTKL